MNHTSYHFCSELMLNKNEETFLNPKKVKLLESIRDFGSISKAAKALGVTYKTAWSWIDKMNELSPVSLVEKVSGGKDGGGTVITSYAKELMRIYDEVTALQDKHLQSLQDSVEHLDNNIKQKTFSFSALEAEVFSVKKLENKVEVHLLLHNKEKLIAYASENFVKINKVKKTSNIRLLIESDVISVSQTLEKEISSRNKLKTQVSNIIIEGEEVLLNLMLSEEQSLTSRITLQSFKALDIKIGDTLMAMFKAYNITLFPRGDK